MATKIKKKIVKKKKVIKKKKKLLRKSNNIYDLIPTINNEGKIVDYTKLVYSESLETNKKFWNKVRVILLNKLNPEYDAICVWKMLRCQTLNDIRGGLIEAACFHYRTGNQYYVYIDVGDCKLYILEGN